MTKEDRRIRYTKMVLKESLLQLMLEKPVSQITAAELCRRAELNRNTFYNHYSDAQDLLSQIEQELYDEILISVAQPLQFESAIGLVGDICASIMKNASVYKVLISENGDKNFLMRILFIAHDKSTQVWRQVAPNLKQDDMTKLYTFFAHGALAVIREWIANDCKEDPYHIATFIEGVCSRGVRGFVKKNANTIFE